MNKNLRSALLITVLMLFIAGGLIFSINKIHFEESISSILPANQNNEVLVEVLDSAKFFDRIVFLISHSDTNLIDPDMLVSAANALTDSINENFIPQFVLKIEGKGDAFSQDIFFDAFYKHLPLYLDEEDYQNLDSIIQHGNFDLLIQEQLNVLNSPAGYMAAKIIFRDPFGIAIRQLNRLKDLQLDDNLTLYRDKLITKDKANLLLFITPADAKNTGKNADFIDHLDRIITGIENLYNENIEINYIGSLPVATANALRIKKDVRLTVTVALIIIVILIYYFFRRKYILWLILLPALFGATVALIYLSFSDQSLSLISLGIGSVILGITVDYALHLTTHLKHQNDIKLTLKKVSIPILMSSITTATAFLCLMLLSSPALKQLGIFAAISVMAAALLSVLFLPLLLWKKSKIVKIEKSNLIEKIAGYRNKNKKLIFLLLIVVSVVLFFFSKKAHFEKDIEKSNYMPVHLEKALKKLNEVSEVYHKKVYLLSKGNSLDEALLELEQSTPLLEDLKNTGGIENFNGIYSLIFSTSKQEEKIEIWNKFWTDERKSLLKTKLSQAATKHHIKPEAYHEFYQLIDQDFMSVPPSVLFSSFSSLISDFNIPLSQGVVVPTIISIENANQKESLTQAFQDESDSFVLDRKDFFNQIFDIIQKDFNKLIRFSLILVFIIILLFFGRFEIAVISFLPILISWIWTLGIMGITGLKLNYFNIIICTIIFGLGVDYSIFITKGLIQKYRYGSDELRSFKSSILISALTTLTGLGVLILAKHPALRSIAGLAIIGIVSVLIVSFTLQPILFQWLVESKGEKRPIPLSFNIIFFSIFHFAGFAIGSIAITMLVPFIVILPVKKVKKQYIARLLAHLYIKNYLKLRTDVKRRKRGLDKNSFKVPSIVISNHQSMLDILIILTLSPNLLMLTKDWVWNNPIFGWVVRFSGHIHISKGYENLLDDIKKQTDNGCSILVFPEGSRSKYGQIRRFHKGGFYLAQKLGLPVQEILMHGVWSVLQKDSFVINPGIITVSKLPSYKIEDNDERAYYHASKQSCENMRKIYAERNRELFVTEYWKYRVNGNYKYKGPVLENYIKIKLRLENYYTEFHSLLPKSGTITDIGCGYGPMAFTLCLSSPERKIIAIDYDENKITTAQNCELTKHCNISFETADAIHYDYIPSDAFLISDILHYLKPQEQHILLSKCIAKLNDKGIIVVRDSDISLKTRHLGTQFSEFLSTHISFNKTKNKLSFVSRKFMEDFASQHNLDIQIIDKTKYTSNLIYILQRKNNGQ